MTNNPTARKQYWKSIANNYHYYKWIVDLLEELMGNDEILEENYETFKKIYHELLDIFEENTTDNRYYRHTKAFVITIAGEFDYNMDNISDAENKFIKIIEEFDEYGWVYDYWITCIAETDTPNRDKIEQLMKETVQKIEIFQEKTYNFEEFVERMINYCDQFNFPKLREQIQFHID